jgi:cell division protease FtsH
MNNDIRKSYMSDENKKRPNTPRGKKPSGGGPNKPNGDFDWSKVIKTVFSWGAVIIAAVIFMQFMRTGSTAGTEITFDIYEKLLKSDKISEIKVVKTDINDYRLDGTLISEERILINNNYIRVQKFTVTLVEPVLQEQIKKWDEREIKYTFVKESNEWLTVLLGLLPWVLIIAVWILIMRRMQSGAGGSRGILKK